VGNVIVFPTVADRAPVVTQVPIPDTNPVEYYTDRIYVEGVLVFAAQGVTGVTGPSGPAPLVEAVPNGTGGFYTDRISVGGVVVFAAQGCTGPTGPTGQMGVDGVTGATGPRVLWPMIIFGA
jgi:hypothetical protein